MNNVILSKLTVYFEFVISSPTFNTFDVFNSKR